MRALAVTALFTLGACFAPADGGVCYSDSDCGGNVCTRVGECSSQPYALRVTWTIGGAAADATSCAAISELELTVIDPAIGASHSVRPVPCASGSFFYDKLPPGYTEVELWSFDVTGRRADRADGSARGTGGMVTLDLTP